MRATLIIIILAISLIGCKEEIPEYKGAYDVECELHGTLDKESGICQCLEGYTGSACGECEATYQDNDNNHSCLPDCSHVDSCFLNSECQDAQGAAQCICDEGYYQLAGGGCMTPFWVSYDTTGTSVGVSVASTLDGMTYVVGGFEGILQISGNGTNLEAGEDDYNSFFLALNPDGTEAWVKSFLGTGYNLASSVVVDDEGSILVAGHFENHIDFGNDVDGKHIVLLAAGARDIFFARFHADGSLIWAKRAGDAGSMQAVSIAAMGSEFYLAGTFSGAAKFGKEDNVFSLTAPENKYDAFLARYDKQGDPIWVQQIGSVFPNETGMPLISTNSGPVIAGEFANLVAFPSTPNFVLNADDPTDAFVAKFNADGSFLWATKVGGEGNDSIRSLASFYNGDILLTGDLRNEVYLKKFIADGSLKWTKEIVQTSYFTTTSSSATTWDGQFVVAGNLKGSAIFGEGENEVELVGDGETNIFIAKYDNDANLVWATVTASVDEATILDILMLRDGSLFATGGIMSSTTFWAGEEQEISVVKDRDGKSKAIVMGVHGPYSGPVVEEEVTE